MAHVSAGQENDAASASGLSLSRIYLTVLLAGAVFCLSRLESARLFVGQVDDRMRELQIRQLFFGHAGWWDMTLPMIQTPEVYSSPWSRLVDAPFVLLAWMLTPFVGQEHGLALAFDLWPPMMFAVFCLQCAAIYRRLGLPAYPSPYLVLSMSTVLMTVALWEFVPGRIDHHNMQLVALMAIMHGLVRWDRVGGLLIGFGSLFSIAIALEGLPFVVFAFAGVVIAFLFRLDGAAIVLKFAATAIVLPCLPLAFLLIGPSGLSSTQCDAFSAPYVVLLVGFGAILWGCSALLSRSGVSAKILAMALPTVVLMAAFAVVFPECLAGPYGMIDPVAAKYWLNNVGQEHGALYLVGQGEQAIIVHAVIFSTVLTCASVMLLFKKYPGKTGAVVALCIAWASLVLTLMLSRYVRFTFAFAPLFLPLALRIVVEKSEATGRYFRIMRRVALACVLACVIAAIAVVVLIPTKLDRDAAGYMVYNECAGASFDAVEALPPGRIAATPAISMKLVSLLPPGSSVAAVPFHRASPGMTRIFEAFLSSDSNVRRQALEPFDYVAACRFSMDTTEGSAPFYEALARGEEWPGLVRLALPQGNSLQFFRIDHSALR